MAEIKNYTLNFAFGRALSALNFADAKLACAEIEHDLSMREVVANG
jgi:hypothetical protein